MVEAEMRYKDGVKHGQTRLYYESGATNMIAHYENGELNGTKKEYDERGRLVYLGNFKNDKPIGVETFYDHAKMLTRKNHYTNEGRIYYYEYRGEDNEQIGSSLLPYFNRNNDTVRLGDPYQVDITLAAPLKGDVYVVIEKSSAKLEGDTLRSGNKRVFTYSIKPDKLGEI